MNLIPWRNKREDRGGLSGDNVLASLREEMDSMFERFFRDPWGTSWLAPLARSGWGPRIDLAESDSAITVTAELPGVEPKDVDISVSGNLLTIRGEKKQEKEEKGRNYHYSERQFGTFQRSIHLPVSVDSENVEAVYKNGMLTITLAKHPEARAKRIAIKEG